jgi:outer membrane protein TolC
MALWSYQSFILSKTFAAGSRDSYGGMAIDLPIFDAGRRRANLALRDSEFDTAVEQYNQTILTALREVANQVTTLQSLHAQVAAQTNALGAIEKNYVLTRSRYQHGIIDYMKVLEAKTNWLSAQNRQVELQAQQLTATVAMIKALGGNYVTLEGNHG